MQRVLEPDCKNIVSTLDLGIESTLGGDVDRLLILLGGGTKKRQQDDIRRAQNLWADYKRRKKEEN